MRATENFPNKVVGFFQLISATSILNYVFQPMTWLLQNTNFIFFCSPACPKQAAVSISVDEHQFAGQK